MGNILEIKDLKVSIKNKPILNGVNLEIKEGEIHAIMGPNGSGKSTLSNVIMGHPKYKIDSGDIIYKGKSILKTAVHKRALMGIFLAFQYPKEIEGLSVEEFLLSAYRAKQTYLDSKKPKILVFRFNRMLEEMMEKLKMPKSFAKRFLNHGFSGGEKKKMESLQMSILKPDLAVMDETDSGLDVDALKTITNHLNETMNKNMSILLITHYQHILKYLEPNHVHVMKAGKIIQSGGKKLAEKLEKEGYENL